MDELMRDQLWDMARRMLAQGHLAGAVEALRQLLAHSPDDADAHALLAVALYGSRRLHAARHEAGLAIGLDPESAFTHYAMGVVETGARRFEEAERHLRAARAIEHRDPAILRALAHLHRLRDQDAQAFALLEEALALDPESTETLIALGDLRLERGETAVAARNALLALEIEPESAGAHVLMGRLRLLEGQTQEAREHAAEALRGDPSHLGALHLFAGIKARANPFLGLWWRWNVWMEALGTTRSILVLLVIFALYRVGRGLAEQQGLTSWLMPMQLVWLAAVAYTWVGPSLFRRSMERDLRPVAFNAKF
jgi:tetratricopeptide (TPR) repeat protein